MQMNSSSRIKSFSIGFEDKIFNEANYSKRIANNINTDHNELYVTFNDAINIIPEISEIYDEPFSDASQIPTIILSKFTKEKVTVALTGDGGDEVFGGYNRYIYGAYIYKKSQFVPSIVKKGLNIIVANLPNFFSFN